MSAPSNKSLHRAALPAWRALPVGIWALGFGSLFMDTSSELIHSLLPVFMVSVLGASMITVGIIEEVAEATAAIMKIFSGALSDYLAAFTKPIFPLAHSVAWVFTARFVDRVGKGIRGAPRDALVADITPSQLRGAAYGLRQALDSVGALLGPLLAGALLLASVIAGALWSAYGASATFLAGAAFAAVAFVGLLARRPQTAT